MKWYVLFFLILNFMSLYSQSDSKPYVLLEDKYIISSTLGYNTAPFILKDDFGLTDNKISYKANMNPVLGFGFTHKWISLGFSFKLPGYLRNTDEYGKSEYLDFDFRLNLLGWHFSGDFHYYEGFRLVNSSLESAPNNSKPIIYNNLSTFSTSLNGYYFFDSTYNTKAAFGMSGLYNTSSYSFYIKNTLNIHRIKNNQNQLIPSYLNSTGPSLWEAHNIGAVDGGVIPGFAYVNNIKGWQFGGMIGIGAVIQAKNYSFSDQTRVFFGLAPRLDLNFYAGYNKNNWFVMLHTNLDNKSIRFNDFTYRQIYYYIRLTLGIRIDKFGSK